MKDEIEIIYLINYFIINYTAEYILLSKTVGASLQQANSCTAINNNYTYIYITNNKMAEKYEASDIVHKFIHYLVQK